MESPRLRAEAFCRRFGVAVPVVLAPMAGACPPALSVAVADAGGMGACGALLMQPAAIAEWAASFRARSAGAFQINLWIPDAAPVRDLAAEAAMRAFLAKWGPAVPAEAGDAVPPDFTAQCEAVLAVGPPVVSSIMGLYPADFVRRLKARGLSWWANVTNLAEARMAAAAGADVIVAQGMEAGGHRGCFDPARPEAGMVGLFALIPAIVAAVDIPVVATGGIASGAGAAAALLLGASAVQIGTGFLRCPEAGISPAWADALACTAPEGTMISRAFSGRAGRCIATGYAVAAGGAGAPGPAPYPVQRGLTASMRAMAGQVDDIDRLQAWAGQSAMQARAAPAGEVAREIWDGARAVLR
jgi:nitronate monooxygenase